VAVATIGLGANLGDREEAIDAALSALDALPVVHVVRVSSLRETDPVGYTDQPRFLNGAAQLETDMPPAALLAALLAVEAGLGRVRTGPRNGPRSIDLDLLLYGDLVVDEPGLQVPHPRAQERCFVLEPLVDLDPGLVIPGSGRAADLLAALSCTPGLVVRPQAPSVPR